MSEAPTMQSRYRVGGMDCGSCATKIDTAVRRLSGVADVSVSAAAGTMTVTHAPDATLAAAIAQRVMGLGYSLAPLATKDAGVVRGAVDHNHHDHAPKLPTDATAAGDGPYAHEHGTGEGDWWNSPKARLTIACGLAVVAAYALSKVSPATAPWGFILAMLVGLVPIARRAVSAALVGTPFSIEMLMTIAAVGAVFINASEEAAAVVFLFLVGELLEGVAAGRARASIKALTTLVPKTALLEVDGKPSEVQADALELGATILVRPGDRIPADGIILSGESAIDEAPVTGESTPKRKSVDAKVFAGTINLDGALRIQVTAAAENNTIARIIKLVEEAQESKAPTERFIDRFSRYYTPAVLAVGALIAIIPPLLFGGIWSEWIYKGLAILLIGCPCALVISTPAAIASALANGARRGLLMKGGAVLEQLGKITTVAFDKTGTLTQGKPQVTDIVAVGKSETEVLALAAALEIGSNHPLAKAILAKAGAAGINAKPASEAAALGGKGVTGTVDGVPLFLGSPQAAGERVPISSGQAQQIAAFNDDGKSVAVLVAGSALAGIIAMRDEARPDAKVGIEALAALRITAVMLTGDNKRTATAIAKSLDMEARAELLPEDKQRIVNELKAQGRVVAKVGDGINDAPALAAADVGIAMGGGTDVALETADAAILHGRVTDVAAMVGLSRQTIANIRQNIVISLGLKAVFLVTTIIGITGLWPAILADTGATVLVTLNALRLLNAKG